MTVKMNSMFFQVMTPCDLISVGTHCLCLQGKTVLHMRLGWHPPLQLSGKVG